MARRGSTGDAGSDTTYSGGGSDTTADSGVTGNGGSDTSYGGGGDASTDAPTGSTGADDPTNGGGNTGGGSGGDDDDDGVAGGGGDRAGGTNTTYSGGGSDTTAGSGITGGDGSDTTYSGGGGKQTTTQTGSGVTGDDSGGGATEPAGTTTPSDTDPDRLDDADRGYSVTRPGEPGAGGQLERSERAQRAAEATERLPGGLESKVGAITGKEGRLANAVQQLQGRIARRVPGVNVTDTNLYNIQRRGDRLTVTFAEQVGDKPTPTERRQRIAKQVASGRENVSREDVTVTSTASGYTATVSRDGAREAVITGAPEREPVETTVETGQPDRGVGVTRGPEGTSVVRPGMTVSEVTRYSQQQLNAQRGPSRGEVRAAVTAYGQRQLTRQNRVTGRFEGERLIDDTDAGTMLTAQDQFSTGQRRQVAASVPAGAPLDLGDTPWQFPETKRQKDARLTASDAAGTGTRDEVAATGDTERVETILQRQSDEFVSGAGDLAAAAQTNREVNRELRRRLSSADTAAIAGGTEATARAAGKGVARFVDPYGAAAGLKNTGETLAFVGGIAGETERAGGALDRANIAAGQRAAGAERTANFAVNNPRQALAGGAVAGAIAVAAPLAAGRATSLGDLSAEIDPRIGPLGETIESRSLSDATARARAFLSDDRAQADLTGPSRRREASETTEISAEDLRGERATAEPPRETDSQRRRRDTRDAFLSDDSGGGRNRLRVEGRGSGRGRGLDPRTRRRLDRAERRSVDEDVTEPETAALATRVGIIGASATLAAGALARRDAAAARSISESDVATGARERLDTASETDVAVDTAADAAADPRTDTSVDTAVGVETDARVDTGIDTDLQTDLESEVDSELDTGLEQDQRVDVERDRQRGLDLGLDFDFRRDVDVDTEREPQDTPRDETPSPGLAGDQGRYRYETPELF